MAALWYRDHPLPLYWDEAAYINQALDDRDTLLDRGILATIKALLFNDPIRPPAYRAIALPVVACLPPSVFLLRAVALTAVILAFGVVARTAGESTSPASGLLASSIAFAAPAIAIHSTWYGTEFALIAGMALLLLAVVQRVRPVLLAAAVALGLLSKASFLILSAPVLLVTLIVSWRERREILRLIGATAAGTAIAFGWWFWHFRAALEFAQLGRTFRRAAFAEPLSASALGAKLNDLVRSSWGIGVTFAVIVLITVAVVRVRNDSPQARRAFWIGVAAFVPLLGLAFLSPVFVGRHYAASLLGLAVILALGIEALAPGLRIAVAAAVLAQTLFLSATHERSLRRVEQTDWTRLRELVPADSPRIAFLGGWPSLSPPEIRFGWRIAGRQAAVEWLWRFEDGSIDWQRVMARVEQSDAVLVVPPGARHRVSRPLGIDENIDNRHNSELIRRLMRSGAFDAPLPFRIGREEPITLLVFRKRFRASGGDR